MSTTTNDATDAQHTTIDGTFDALFADGDLVPADAPPAERWLAKEYPDMLADINDRHTQHDLSRADIIDQVASKLALRRKEQGESVTLSDGAPVVTHHGVTNNNRFIPSTGIIGDARECPTCSADMHPGHIQQTRSADEAGTEVYKCSNPTCNHTERRTD